MSRRLHGVGVLACAEFASGVHVFLTNRLIWKKSASSVCGLSGTKLGRGASAGKELCAGKVLRAGKLLTEVTSTRKERAKW